MAHCTYGYGKHTGIAHFYSTIVRLSNSPPQGFIQWQRGQASPNIKASPPKTHAYQYKILAATYCLRSHQMASWDTSFLRGVGRGNAPRPYTSGSANYTYMPTPRTEPPSENVISCSLSLQLSCL